MSTPKYKYEQQYVENRHTRIITVILFSLSLMGLILSAAAIITGSAKGSTLVLFFLCFAGTLAGAARADGAWTKKRKRVPIDAPTNKSKLQEMADGD